MTRKELIPLIERADQLHRRNEILTVAGVVFSLFATGTINGFSAVTLPSLLEPDSEIQASPDDLSWIASMVVIGCILGNFASGIISEWIGRKKTILVSSVIFFFGWIIIAEASGVWEILAGRVLTGLASGFYSTAVQVYICEVCTPATRAASGSTPTLMVSIGILSTYILGSISNWRIVALICSGFPLIVFIYCFFLPESPVWLISKGRDTEALQALIWLRNDTEQAEQETLRLQYLKERRIDSSFSLKSCCQRLADRGVFVPLLIGTTCFVFQQFSGIYPIVFYSTLIFRYADHFINDYLETICTGFVRMFATLIAIFLVNFMKRRTLLILSGSLMCISNGILGCYFYLREAESEMMRIMTNETSNPLSSSSFAESSPNFQVTIGNDISIEWVPLVCLLVFMAGYSIGFGIIPWFLMAEIMPSDVRSLSCSIAFSVGQICLFTAVKTFLQLVEILDAEGTFWFYSSISFLSVIFVLTCVPETSNLNDYEIEDIFQKHKKGDQKHSGFIDEEEHEF